MYHTIFDISGLLPILHAVSSLVLRCMGWKVEGRMPPTVKKCVIIGVPHTSNWDFLIMLLAACNLELPIHWMGKDSLTRFPFRSLMMWLGNIPVDRSKTSGLVASSAHELRIASGRMYIVIPPEGTRKGTGTWKTGFYFTALSAGVPIALGYLDYENKKTGILSMFFPTGSLEADMSAIQKLYKPFKGKNPR